MAKLEHFVRCKNLWLEPIGSICKAEVAKMKFGSKMPISGSIVWAKLQNNVLDCCSIFVRSNKSLMVFENILHLH